MTRIVHCVTSEPEMLGKKLRSIRAEGRILILTHDNPDPDALAGAWGLRRILKKLFERDAVIAYGGLIGRAENRALVSRLGIPLQTYTPSLVRQSDTIIMIDCQPHTGNSSLPEDIDPDVVIDHHPRRESTQVKQWAHIDVEAGAVSSLITSALFELDISIPKKLATALFYAIRSETRDLGWEHTRRDQEGYLHLLPLVDFQALHRIESPPLSAEYFHSVKQALDRSRIRKDMVVCPLSRVPYPELPAEIADFLIRREGIEVAFVAGLYREDLFISMRSRRKDLDLSRVIRVLLEGLGTGGGHERMAGGRVPGAAARGYRHLEAELTGRVFRLFRLSRSPETPFF